jgi:hypothetical protein
MEGDVLLTVEQVKQRGVRAGERFEVAHASWLNIHSADAAEVGAQITYARSPTVEAFSSAAKSAEEVEVPDIYVNDRLLQSPSRASR